MATKSTTNKPKASKKQIDFIVTTSNPSDASSAKANKKRVRSVAALKSWPERRKKMFQDLEAAGTGHGAFLVEDSPPQPKTADREVAAPKKWAERRTKTFRGGGEPIDVREQPFFEQPAQQPRWVQQPPFLPFDHGKIQPPPGFTDTSPRYVTYGAIPDRTPPPRDRQWSGSYYGDNVITPTGSSSSLYEPTVAQVPPTAPMPNWQSEYSIGSMVNFGPVYSQATTISVLPNNKKRMVDGYDKESHHGSGSMVLLTPPASPNTDAARGRADPFNCYNNVEWQPWFDKILHHVVNIYAPRGWPALKVTREQGMKWEWFLTQKALAEPALFYVRLLFGSGDLIVQGGLPAKTRLWLRAQAIKHINEALGDPRRACSDALILAVGRIALHEHMYGDREASVAIHRPAQRRMVEMRGGMKALEFPEVVKRAMKWSDHIMAVGTHTEEMLNEEGKEQEVTVKESIKAIESYAPYLMPRVRTQIRVDELLNED